MMRLCIRAARDRVTYVPQWIWIAWLEPGQPLRDNKRNMVPSLDSVIVGNGYHTWDEAIQAGETALRFATTRWLNDSHGITRVLRTRGRL